MLVTAAPVYISHQTFRSPSLSVLEGKRIVWSLPTGTRVGFGVVKGSTIPYVLLNVKLDDGSRRNLSGLFSVWPEASVDKTSPHTFKIGNNRVLIVSGAHNTNSELKALDRLYLGIRLA